MRLLVTTHGSFCEGILETYQMIVGSCEGIDTLKLDDEGVENYRHRLMNWFKTYETEKVLVLCDLYGGTPYNECYRYYLEHQESVQIVTGLNLPMLIEAGLVLNVGHDLNTLAELAVNTGKSGVSKLEACSCYEEDLEF